MWNLNLPASPHATLGQMDITLSIATGKEGLNLEAHRGEFLHLKKDLVNHESLIQNPTTNIPFRDPRRPASASDRLRAVVRGARKRQLTPSKIHCIFCITKN